MNRYADLLSAMVERDGVFCSIASYAMMTLITVLLFSLLARWKKLPEKLQRIFGAFKNALYAYALLAYIALFWMTVK
jgi:hypothetical protein